MSSNESMLVDITGFSGAEEIHSVANSSYKIQNDSVIVSRDSMSSCSSSDESDDDMPFFGRSERLDEALYMLNQNRELDESESEEEQTLWYQVYKASRQLAVIDWNYHVNRATVTNKNNEARHTRKYNQRTK